jgi:hypothetical protein
VLAACFVLGAKASGAQVESFRLTIYDDSNRVNIGHPATVGAAFRVAYIMTELGSFST